MVEHLTLARPYAQAIFQIAQKEQNFSEWEKRLDALALIVQDLQTKDFLSKPGTSNASRCTFMLSLLPEHNQAAELARFLETLMEQDRWPVLPQIASIYQNLVHEAQATLSVKIHTAYPMDDNDQQALAATLSEKYGKKVIIAELQVHPELLSGVRIFAGDQMIDASVRGRLHAMAAHLKY